VTVGFFLGALGNYALKGNMEKGVTLCVPPLFFFRGW
jgi:hypothetical protein